MQTITNQKIKLSLSGAAVALVAASEIPVSPGP
jgi:hypothetical protein